MKLPKTEKDFEELMKGIKWNRFLPPIVSVMQPVIIGGLWLLFSRLDTRADAVSKFIAVAESIPTIDLNLPKPVVLASLYHAIDEALDILKDVIEFMEDIEIPSAEEIIDEVKETVKEEIIDPVLGERDLLEEEQFLIDFKSCRDQTKISLGLLYSKYTAQPWIIACLIKKGYRGSELLTSSVKQLL